MFKDITRYLLLSLLPLTIVYAEPRLSEQNQQQLVDSSINHHGAGFANLEHQKYGDRVFLQWSPLPIPAEDYLQLPNGLQLSYGEIVMFAGDFFGNPDKPISNCSEQEREQCFKTHFSTLAVQVAVNDSCKDPSRLINNYRVYLKQLNDEMAQAGQQGQPEWEFYEQHTAEINQQLNRLSCGGSSVTPYFPLGMYLRLAQVNFDHFVPDSLIAYKTGHLLALQTAKEANQLLLDHHHEQARLTLNLAYAQNAFANHFLTDSMSSGHMRTPRRAVHNDVALPAILNLVLANLMHNEDSDYGLDVVNSQGILWHAFGDGRLEHPEAKTHREILIKIMQMSADAVYQTFRTGILPTEYEELSWLPDYSKIDTLNNFSPLFKVENGVLLKRVQNFNRYDFSWTRYWSGLITLIQFEVSQRAK